MGDVGGGICGERQDQDESAARGMGGEPGQQPADRDRDHQTNADPDHDREGQCPGCLCRRQCAGHRRRHRDLVQHQGRGVVGEPLPLQNRLKTPG
jgi:hypothetical protein